MRTDEVGVVDVAVIEVPAGLHLGLHGLDHFAFAEDLVVHLDAGDFLEGAGQHLGFVAMRRNTFRQHVDFHARIGRGGVDEPLHLGHLLVFRERRWLELVIDPALCGGLVGPRAIHPRNDGTRRHRGK